MTELAYLADIDAAYVRTFRARVLSRPPGGMVLDRTFFYAVGGGQPADHGTLTGAEGTSVRVVNVSKSGASVVHQVRGTPGALASLGVGSEVEGAIDWERRHRHMRLHTAQHFLSARIYARTGRRTARAVLGGSEGSLDLDGPLPPQALPELAEDVREAVARSKAVRVLHIPRAEWLAAPAARTGLVPLAAHIDPVRIIEIEGVDRCPCGGTHLRSTGEIGPIQLRGLAPLADGGSKLTFSLGSGPDPNPSA